MTTSRLAITKGTVSNSMSTMLPEDLKNIDYSALEEIGFDESHIIQIYREYMKKPELSLSVDIIQDSINALAFDLKHNNVAKNLKHHPVVFLTCLLKRGQPYSSKTPEKVLTPKEEAMIEYLLAQEQKNAKILELERKAKSFALQEWLNALSEEDLLSFNEDGDNIRPEGMPEKIHQVSKKKKALANAKEYFDNIVWPTKCKEILNEQEDINN